MRWANFANSFWYMDAMAAKAAHGFSVFCRQDFIGADYGTVICDPRFFPTPAVSILLHLLLMMIIFTSTITFSPCLLGLLDCSTQTPLPDYYLSKIWTELMGSGVLDAAVLAGPRTIRAYAHCAADDVRDLVVLLLNLDNQPVDAALVAGSTANAPRTEWHFTAGSDGLGGTGVRLGGSELVWASGQPLPSMPGVRRESGHLVHLEEHSIVFVRLAGSAPVGLC